MTAAASNQQASLPVASSSSSSNGLQPNGEAIHNGRAYSSNSSSGKGVVSRLREHFQNGSGSNSNPLTEDEELAQEFQQEELRKFQTHLDNEAVRQNDALIASLLELQTQAALPLPGLDDEPIALPNFQAEQPLPPQTNHISDERKQFSWMLYHAMRQVKKELEAVHSKDDLDAAYGEPYDAVMDHAVLRLLDLAVREAKDFRLVDDPVDLILFAQENVMGQVYNSFFEIHSLLVELSSDHRKILIALLNHKDEPKDVPEQVKKIFNMIADFRGLILLPRIMNNVNRDKKDEIPFSKIFDS